MYPNFDMERSSVSSTLNFQECSEFPSRPTHIILGEKDVTCSKFCLFCFISSLTWVTHSVINTSQFLYFHEAHCASELPF